MYYLNNTPTVESIFKGCLFPAVKSQCNPFLPVFLFASLT